MDDSTQYFQKAFFNPFRSSGNWKERFMYLHPGVEAYLRQILFIGLRKNGVNYSDAQKCVYENRLVEEFPSHFQTLFGKDWNSFIQPNVALSQLWKLYDCQTKPIRNRVFHGMRSYDEELFKMCYQIDLSRIESLGKHLYSQYQHDFLPPLKNLKLPRVGKNGVSPTTILKKIRSGKAPLYSDTKEDLARLKQDLGNIGIY